MKKKVYWQTTYGKVEVLERIFRVSGTKLRPFSNSSGVKCRSYSLPLQRVIVDFGTDTSFKDAQAKIQEHYAVEVPEAAIRHITEIHAKNINNINENESKIYKKAVDCLICETDGTMIPIVNIELGENTNKKIDHRKYRKTFWKEARLCFSREKDSTTRVFTVVFGSVNATGDALVDSSFYPNTYTNRGARNSVNSVFLLNQYNTSKPSGVPAGDPAESRLSGAPKSLGISDENAFSESEKSTNASSISTGENSPAGTAGKPLLR